MLFYNKSSMYYESADESESAEKADEDVEKTEPAEIEECTSYIEAAFQICEENEENWNRIMEATAITELSAVVEGCVEALDEAEGDSFFDKVKSAFLRFWAKIQGIATHFLSFIKSKIGDDSAFVSKYKKQIEAGARYAKSPDCSTVKAGFSFTDIIDMNLAVEFISDTARKTESLAESDSEDTAKNYNDTLNGKEFADGLREGLVGSSTSAGSFAKDINQKLKGKEIENILTAWDAATVMNGVKDTSKLIKSTKECQDKIKKAIKKEIETCEKGKKKAKNDKHSNSVSIYKTGLAAMNQTNSVITVVFNQNIAALKAKKNQYKVICTKWIGMAPKATSESGYMGSGSLLDDIQFI